MLIHDPHAFANPDGLAPNKSHLPGVGRDVPGTSVTAGGSIWIILPLLVLVQITSFADVGAPAGG